MFRAVGSFLEFTNDGAEVVSQNMIMLIYFEFLVIPPLLMAYNWFP